MLEQFRMVRALVVGDVMLDRYQQGTVSRISAEAPVPVVRLEREWTAPGGAGHVAASLAGLECQVTLCGLVGRDQAAQQLAQGLNWAGVAVPKLVVVEKVRTITKTRIVAGTGQQLLRLDEEPAPQEWNAGLASLREASLAYLPQVDVLVLADYDKGALTAEILKELLQAARQRSLPIIVDPKKADLSVYHGASVLTPNTLEVERALGKRLQTREDFEQAVWQLRQRLDLQAMLITRGPQGMTGADTDGVFHVAARVREVADVSGAGDTVVAVLAAALGRGLPWRWACGLASEAAGIAVSKPGAYVVKSHELHAVLNGQTSRLVSWETAQRQIQEEQARGHRVVFTNGCFDLLHGGHLYCLEEARRLGDFLVVGLNSDQSIRGLKGPTRPIVPQDQRALLLAGLACVDLVVLFDDPTPAALVETLQPDVLVKGGDHDPKTIVGGDVVRKRGGQVVVIPRREGLSTSDILAKIREHDAPGSEG